MTVNDRYQDLVEAVDTVPVAAVDTAVVDMAVVDMAAVAVGLGLKSVQKHNQMRSEFTNDDNECLCRDK
jgi:hypothetical protein